MTVTAQYGVFDEADEGQLWALRQVLTAPDGGFPTGVTFSAGVLFVSDRDNRKIIAYDPNGDLMTLANDDWGAEQAENPSSPTFDWSPNQLTTATVDVVDGNGTTPTAAILVSDGTATRAFAFDTTGKYLFTISLQRPSAPSEPGVAINGLAMSPGAKFVLTTTSNPPTLSLEGSFAASWADDFGIEGVAVDGAVLWYRDQGFEYNSEAQFYPPSAAELLGTEGEDSDARPAREPYGVTFDSAGNLYTVDSVTERLNAYAPAADGGFTHLFTFGTTVSDGTTDKFYQSFGMTYWADGPGGARLFVADAINNRVQVYRPNLTTPGAETLDYLFTIDGLGKLDGFPFAVAIDPITGRLAVTDDNGSPPRVWILQTTNLAAFDLQVLDANNAPVETVCSGNSAQGIAPQNYKVRFSLTVPAGRPAIPDVTPQLNIVDIDGESTTQIFSSTPLQQLEVVTYEYSLTAPNDPVVGAITFEAGATTSPPAYVLFKDTVLAVSDCSAGNQAPTITASPAPGFEGKQLSGWTPVFPDEIYKIRLFAQDDGGIRRIVYDLTDANQPPVIAPLEHPGAPSPTQHYDVPLPELRHTRIDFRAWDDKLLASAWDSLDVTLVRVGQWNAEGNTVSIIIGAPLPGSNVTFSATGLPPVLVINPVTGRISGTLGYTTAGLHMVTLTESNGTTQSSVTFKWTVENFNLAPVAVIDSYGTNEDTPLTVPLAGVLSNDTNEDLAPLTAVLVSGPLHGTLALAVNGSFLYTPAANFHGTDTFSYKATDGAADSAPTTVTIAVQSVNDLPTVADDTATMNEDAGPLTITVLANDSDIEAPLTVTAVTQPAGGLVTFGSTSVTFTPALNFFGVATFTYTVTDSNGATATATVKVTVNAVNDAPVAVNNSYSTGEDTALTVPAASGVLSNDTDAEANPLTASLVTGPSHGTLVLNTDGSFLYTPALDFYGSDSFIYKASASALTSTATATITVVPSNLSPVCTAVITPTVIWPVNHKQVYLSLSGITDPEGGALIVRFTAILQDEPTNGPGQGNTMQDGGIEDNGVRAWVRAERIGNPKAPGDGRVYLIAYKATDAGGLSCAATVTIGVPHDQGKGPAVLSPGRWNSLTGQPVVTVP